MSTNRAAIARRRPAGVLAAFVVAVGALVLAATDFAVAGGTDPSTASTTVGPVVASGQDETEVEIGVDVEREDGTTPTTEPGTIGSTTSTSTTRPPAAPGGGGGPALGDPTEIAGVVVERSPVAPPAAPDAMAATGASSTLLLVAAGALLIDLGYLALTAVPAQLRRRPGGRPGLVVP